MADRWGTSRLLLINVCAVFYQLFSASANLHVLNNITWSSAFNTCYHHGEQLYNTSDITSLSDVLAGSYWIGAKVQYSSWMWTADNTPLFRYVGEFKESQSVEFYQIKYDNQASRCYFECRKNKTYAHDVLCVGLQGENCYCLPEIGCYDVSSRGLQRENKTRCEGNSNEICGTEDTMSLYDTNLIIKYVKWPLDIDGVCGYIEEDVHIYVKSEENCNSHKGFICDCGEDYSSPSCHHHNMTHSWFSANSNCSLTKINIFKTKLIRPNMSDGVQYWIGLKRDRQIVWFDGFYNETLNISSTGNGCVLLEKFSNGKTSFSISDCSELHSAICISNFSVQTSIQTSTDVIRTQTSTDVIRTQTSTDVITTQTDVAVRVSVTVLTVLVTCAVVAVV